MNNEFILNQAQLFARRLEEFAPGDRDRQIERAYLIKPCLPQPEESGWRRNS